MSCIPSRVLLTSGKQPFDHEVRSGGEVQNIVLLLSVYAQEIDPRGLATWQMVHHPLSCGETCKSKTIESADRSNHASLAS